MAVCSIDSWNMNLENLVGAAVAAPLFRDVKVEGGQITKGIVIDSSGSTLSQLRGECVPITSSALFDITRMTFRFRLRDAGSEIGILYTGLAMIRASGEKARFRGTWIAHAPDADTPAAADEVEAGLVLPGEGDTGTGSGSQT